MSSNRASHDPFISQPPLQPTTSNATSLGPPSSLRSQTSTHSLRSNASTASNRARQRTGNTNAAGSNLFAPSLSRRPTSTSRSRAAQRLEDRVLADSDSEHDISSSQQLHKQRQGTQSRRVRPHGSPEGRHPRSRGKHFPHEDEQQEFVNRQPDGGYLLGGSGGFGENTAAVPAMAVEKTEEEKEQDGGLQLNQDADDQDADVSLMTEIDASYTAISRQYFTNGGYLGSVKDRQQGEEYQEQLRVPMMMRLREQVLQQLEEERWIHEPLDRFQQAVP